MVRGTTGTIAAKGAGTWQGVSADHLISMREMNEIHLYDPRDLAIRCGAGATISSIRGALESAGLRVLPGAPGAGDRSIGSVLVTGTANMSNLSSGSWSDQVLGMEFVTGDGRVVSVGGRVMKNVAGFDLGRLMIGSRGSLGIVTSVHLRARPLPECTETWTLSTRQPPEIARKLLEKRIPLVNTVVETENGDWSITSVVEGDRSHVRCLTDELARLGFRQSARLPHFEVRPFVARIGATMSRLVSVLEPLAGAAESVQVNLARGGRFGTSDSTAFESIRDQLSAASVPVVVERAPETWLRQNQPVDHIQEQTRVVIDRLRSGMDPDARFAVSSLF